VPSAHTRTSPLTVTFTFYPLNSIYPKIDKGQPQGIASTETG